MILSHHLRAPFASLPGVLHYPIVQEPQRLAIRVVLHPAALERAGAIVPPIEVEIVTRLEREPRGAKLKLVKSM